MMPRFLLALLATQCLQTMPAMAGEIEQPLRAVIDIRSTHSDGRHSMRELALMAKNRGIQVLAYTEHDRMGIRFGLKPAPNILGYTYERPSLYTTGLDAFFDELKQIRAAFPQMTLLAGTESIPSYYWSGMPFRGVSLDEIMAHPLKGLSLHGADRHLITLGLEEPEQAEALPSYDLRHARQHPALSIVVWLSLVLLSLLVAIVRRRKFVPVLVFSCACAALFLAWTGKSGMDADADFIEKAQEHGLFTIWAHPGTLSGTHEGPGGIRLETPPYSERVFQEPTADAFAAKYGDTDENTVAGGLWDRYLMDYMRGRHKRPIWGVSAGDFHFQGMAGEVLGNYPMDIWAAGRSPELILEAMRHGHMVAWYMPKGRNIGVKKLYLQDMLGTRLIPGDKKKVTSQVVLSMELADLTPLQTTGIPFSELAEIIIDGRRTARVRAGLDTPVREVLQLGPGPHVIRIRSSSMEANPFLVYVQG